MDEQSELRLELKRDFTEFLDQDFGRETGQGRYVQKVDDLLKQYPQTKRVRLPVDLQGERWQGTAEDSRWRRMGVKATAAPGRPQRLSLRACTAQASNQCAPSRCRRPFRLQCRAAPPGAGRPCHLHAAV